LGSYLRQINELEERRAIYGVAESGTWGKYLVGCGVDGDLYGVKADY